MAQDPQHTLVDSNGNAVAHFFVDGTGAVAIEHPSSGETVTLDGDGLQASAVDADSADVTNQVSAGSMSTDDLSVTTVGAHAQLSTVQSISSGTSTKVQFDTTAFNDDSQFDTSNHEFVVGAPGVYTIDAQIQFQNMSAGDLMVSEIHVNGTRAAGNNYIMGDAGKQSVPISRAVRLSAGDSVDIRCFHNAGSSKDVGASQDVGDVVFASFVKIG